MLDPLGDNRTTYIEYRLDYNVLILEMVHNTDFNELQNYIQYK